MKPRTKIDQWCEAVIEAGWLAALIVAPLFFNIHSERVFEPDKLTLVRSIALVMATAWLIRAIEGWRVPRQRVIATAWLIRTTEGWRVPRQTDASRSERLPLWQRVYRAWQSPAGHEPEKPCTR